MSSRPPSSRLASFMDGYTNRKPQIVWKRFAADLENPVAAMLKIGAGQPYSFLLESVEGGSHRGRYSAIGLWPDLIWRTRNGQAEVSHCQQGSVFTPCPDSPLDSLRILIEDSRIDLPEELPPLAAGLFGYVGYDTMRWVESIADENPDPLGLPDALFVRPKVMMVFDNISDELTITTPVRPSEKLDAETAFDAAQTRISECVDRLKTRLGPARLSPVPESASSLPDSSFQPDSNMTPDAYREIVEQAQEYIRAGDIFQVVLSQRFSIPFDLPTFSLYRSLRHLNPSPFLFHFNFDDFVAVGSSPEILVRRRDQEVTIRPIAGTRKRGISMAEDHALAEELINDPKELAEHLMLLDLGRNDIGKVSVTGSVRVTDQMIIERYSHVMHIVSNVVGICEPGKDALDTLLAGFPAGTVSGAPKVRAMQIIEDLEPERRGLYAGGVGYFSCTGDLDFCIALRTAVVKDNRMYIQAGGGVVADSNPEGEYQETRNKARALIRAAQHAGNFPVQ